MRKCEINRQKENLLVRGKRKFIEGIKNKTFLITLLLIFLKNLLFIFLISDDNANGVNLKLVFYSMPPILLWIAILTAFISIGFLFRGKIQRFVFWLMDFLFTILVIGDMWYFRSNSVFLNYHMFGMTSNLDNLGSSIISMIRTIDFLFIIDLIVFGVLIFKGNKESNKRNVVGGLLIFIISISYLYYAHIKVDKLGMGFENQLLFRGSWSPNQTMSNLTPIGYHIYDWFDYKEQCKPYVFTEEEEKEDKEILLSLKEDNEDNEYAALLKGKNLLIIQWESLENFVINNKVDGQEITPNLNKLLNNSLYFNNFYEQTYNGTSSDAELMLNTSVFPVREGTTFFRYPNNTYKYSLPNIFESLGYSTLVSHPDKGSYWNWMSNLKSIGYDVCLDSTDYDTSDQINLGVSDESYFNQIKDKIGALQQPFLAYTITLTSHSPFDMPKDKRYLTLPDNLEETKLGGYFQSINYTDKYLGIMLEELEKQGVLDNTVVAIYGDHEGVHKFYDDELKNIKNMEPWMKENNRRVPFIIYNKDLNKEEFSLYGGQIDMLPTLAYLFGAPKKQYNTIYTLGRNLLNTNLDYVLLSNRNILQNNLDEDKMEAVGKLLDISDKMIRGNYFKGDE